jgi:hypothetical protein
MIRRAPRVRAHLHHRLDDRFHVLADPSSPRRRLADRATRDQDRGDPDDGRERFVVGHEIAHITSRHLRADARKVDPATSTPAEINTRPRAQEIEADVIGAALSIESQPAPRPGAVGIVMFLHALRLAEEVGAIVPDGKHLSAVERKTLLWTTLPQRRRLRADDFMGR